MTPIHKRSESQNNILVMHQLQQLTEYDSKKKHRHTYFEFFEFEKSGGTHMIDFEKFSIEVNSVHIVAPGQVLQVKRILNSNGYVFLFDHNCLVIDVSAPNYLFSSNVAKVVKRVLNEIVHNRTGESVSTLMYKQLILEAKVQLNDGQSSKKAAYDLYFNDPVHFSKFLSRKLVYRQRNSEKCINDAKLYME